MTPCQSSNVPYVQCDCPVHDHVAQLLNIPSTRKDGWGHVKRLSKPSTVESEEIIPVYEFGKAEPVHVIIDSIVDSPRFLYEEHAEDEYTAYKKRLLEVMKTFQAIPK